MANNPYINKVEYNGQTLIDLTGLTLTAGDVAQGYTTHNGAGQQITGTAVNAQCVAYKNGGRINLYLPSTVATVSGNNITIAERSE